MPSGTTLLNVPLRGRTSEAGKGERRRCVFSALRPLRPTVDSLMQGKRRREDGKEEGSGVGAVLKRQRVGDIEEEAQPTHAAPVGPPDAGEATDDEDTMPEAEYNSRLQKTGTAVVGGEEEACLFYCETAGATHIGHRTENQDTYYIDPFYDPEALVAAVCGSLAPPPATSAQANPFALAFALEQAEDVAWEQPSRPGAAAVGLGAGDCPPAAGMATGAEAAGDGGALPPPGEANGHSSGAGTRETVKMRERVLQGMRSGLMGSECGTQALEETREAHPTHTTEERRERESNQVPGLTESNEEVGKEAEKEERATKRFSATVGIYAVFDGHGKMGKEAAEVALEMVPGRVRQYLPDVPSLVMTAADVEAAVTRALAETQRKLLRTAAQKNESDQEFGTTCILAVLWGGNKLTVANGTLAVALRSTAPSIPLLAETRPPPLLQD